MSNKKSKETLKPSRLYTALKVSANIAVGPLGFRAEPHPQGDQSCSRSELQADRPDSIVTLDENSRALRLVTHGKKNDDPGPSLPGTSTPAVVAHCVAEITDEPTGERSQSPLS